MRKGSPDAAILFPNNVIDGAWFDEQELVGGGVMPHKGFDVHMPAIYSAGVFSEKLPERFCGGFIPYHMSIWLLQSGAEVVTVVVVFGPIIVPAPL
jgi:hypothetical protein